MASVLGHENSYNRDAWAMWGQRGAWVLAGGRSRAHGMQGLPLWGRPRAALTARKGFAGQSRRQRAQGDGAGVQRGLFRQRRAELFPNEWGQLC